MKLLLDMNIPLKYTALLLNKGINSLRWSAVGLPNEADDEIMKYASDNNLIVLTFDLDFSAILSSTHDLKPSIIQVRSSVLNAEQTVDFIAEALLRNTHELKEGAILTIDTKRARLRLLPL
jgi:predicted nuclease of predicted toxin-antitoxin system